MTAPFITFTVATVKEGKHADFEKLNRAMTDLVEAEEPRVIAFDVMADGTNMSKLTQDDLDDAAHSLNGRPRQTLNWKTTITKTRRNVAMTT